MNRVAEIERDILHGHLFCGVGAGAKGFNRGAARVGITRARSVCVGGIDVDPAACRDFENIAGVKATCMDLFTRPQYEAFHGRSPPVGWREAIPSDISAAFGGRRPHIAFLSAPCKGFSGLLSESSSKMAKYQALNGLTLRGLWLLLEEYRDDPIELIIFENVPRIATRGRHLLDQIIALLRSYGYAVAETKHDCGELGGLGQSRKRFLLVARHEAKVPAFLYEPPKHRLLGVGEVLEKLPLPLSGLGGAMHRMPALQWKTWVRLAFVRAGADWRSLNDLAVEDGMLRDYGIVPDTSWHRGVYGVRRWEDPSGAVTSRGTPSCGAFAVADPRAGALISGARPNYGVNGWDQIGATVTSARSPGQGRGAVADPRVDGHPRSVQLGVRPWGQPAGVVTGQMAAGQGPNSVADPRITGKRFNTTFRTVSWSETSPAVAGPGGPGGGLGIADPRTGYKPGTHHNLFRIIQWDSPSGAVCGSDHVTGGAAAVADVRFANWHPGASSSKLRVTPWDGAARPVTGSQQVASGAGAVADPRFEGRERSTTFGVKDWAEPSNLVAGESYPSNGAFAVADPRNRVSIFPPSNEDEKSDMGKIGPGPEPAAPSENSGLTEGVGESWDGLGISPTLPAPSDRLVCVIQALDRTWHRPFTTLELAALQGLVDPEEQFELDGLSDSSWRERIGNCVPPPSAQAIANMMFETLLLSWSGTTFTLSSTPIWVRDLAVALSVQPQEMPSW